MNNAGNSVFHLYNGKIIKIGGFMRSTLFFLVFLFSLTACVTTETSSFTKNKSVEKEVEARVQLALRYLQQGDPEMAIYHMKEIVDKQPKEARIHEVLGLALWETGETDLAEKHFKKMVKYDKGYSRGRMNFAAFLMANKRYKNAHSQLDYVVADIYYPNRAQAFYMLATVEAKLGNEEDMVEAYQRSLKLNKRYSPVLLELSLYRYKQAEFAESYQLHQRYRSSVRQSSAQGLLLGIKLARKFDDKSEEASYALALKNLYPKSKEYLEFLDLK